MGKFARFCNGKLPNGTPVLIGDIYPMQNQALNSFAAGLMAVIELEGWKMKPLSEAAGMNESAVRDLFRKNTAPKVTNAYALAHAVGRTVDELIELGAANGGAMLAPTQTIAVAGRVGAGARVAPVDDHARGDGLYTIARPPHLGTGSVVGVEVTGDSMAPVYQHGDVLLYRREVIGVPDECVGRICVAEDAQGNAWVKQVKRGTAPGLFHLLSANPQGDNLLDVPLAWAAPVRLHLPLEFVRRVG